jgi:hypothetical protein
LESSCQEIRPEIGEELSGDKTGDWRGAVRRKDRSSKIMYNAGVATRLHVDSDYQKS